MPKEASFEKLISKIELGVGVALALLIGYLHYVFMLHAGGLWRDEIVSFNIATNPSFIQGFNFLAMESFPGFFHFLMRLWHEMGFAATDSGIRFFGALIGLSLLVAFWIAGRQLGCRVPLFSSMLIGLSPLAIRTTDAIRAYGIGATLIILTLGLVWVTVQKPSRKNIVYASIVATLSVQSLYQNSFLLLAICLGGLAVTARRRLRNHTLAILSIGTVSALSLLIYAKILHQTHEYKELIVVPGLLSERILQSFPAALSVGGKFMLWLWLVLVLIGIVIATRKQFQLSTPEQSTNQQDLQLFAMVTLVTSILSFFIFLKIIDLLTQDWYYISLMVLVAVLLDTIFATLSSIVIWRASRLLAIAVLSLYLFFQAIPGVQLRQTNIDIIADKLVNEVGKDDFIIVSHWYCGTTFARYFHADTTWSTLPPLSDYSLQRLDLFKEQMLLLDPIAPIIKKISETLKSGNRLWIVGGLESLPEGQVLPELPPAPNSQWGWDHDAYSAIWEMQTLNFIQQHAQQAQVVAVPIAHSVNWYEKSTLVLITGWRE